MKTHNTRIKEEHIIDYLDKNLKDCPEKIFVIIRIREAMEDYPFDIDYEEWVDLPDDSSCVCSRCKREVKRYWHKHAEYKVIGISEYIKYVVPPSLTETYLCEHCYNEIVGIY
jgi:hypothetical protein